MKWIVSDNLVKYAAAVAEMEACVAGILDGTREETIWCLEHPPIYTAGTSAKESDLLNPRFPVFATGRGGEYTYHGPGQRVVYAMLDLKARDAQDIRRYVWLLEEWIIQTLQLFGVTAERRDGRVGLWVAMEQYGGLPGSESKIAAIGVRVRKWVTFHGVSINLNPDLSHFDGIVPCGVSEHGVTSLEALGIQTDKPAFDTALKECFERVFGTVKQPWPGRN